MKICPICSSGDLSLWGTKNSYDIYKCRSCTHLFVDLAINVNLNSLVEDDFRSTITNNMMKNDEDYYHHLVQGEQEELHTYVTFKVIDKIIKQLTFDESGSWLDIGSGSGYLVQQISKLGWDVIGVEPGGWGQIAAKEKKINIIKDFLTEDTFNKKFDVISATDVLEHQSNPGEFIELIKYYLKPNGIVIFSIPFADSMYAKLLRSKWSMIAPPTHCQFFNNKSMNFFAKKFNFSIIEKVQYDSTKIRFLNRFDFASKLVNRVLNTNDLGDQAVIVLTLNKNV